MSKLTELYRRSAVEEPPRHLDQEILSRAKHALGRPRLTSPFSGSWMMKSCGA